MNELQNALEVSAVLDDGYPDRLDPAHKGQETVHGALSNKRQMTWARPSPDLSARIMLRASLVRPQRKARRWPLALAAMVALGTGAAWMVLLQSPLPSPAVPGPLADSGPRPEDTGPTLEPQPTIDLSLLTRLPARTEPTLLALESPLRREIEAIAVDARRGMDTVMSKLPISVSMNLAP